MDVPEPDHEAAKAALRRRLLATRRGLDLAQRDAAGRALCARVLAVPEIAAARVLAAYVSVGSEPATRDLLARWHAAGVTVLLPLMRPDRDLDWVAYGGPATLEPAGHGLLEPVGPPLGVAAVGTADAVLVPALAVDRAGWRLGRGAGCYDRVLGRVPADRLVAALLYDGEVIDAVPVQPHDRPVHAAITPSGVHRFAPH